jgi:16S rRNA (uracil1498-N3)-methyltransferase
MEVAAAQPWRDFVAGGPDAALRLAAHPGGEPLATALRGLRDQGPPGEVLLAVGPEGGLTDDEVAAARAARWRIVDLGPRVLRVETAALVLSAAVAQ